jgi:hypothetical protein
MMAREFEVRWEGDGAGYNQLDYAIEPRGAGSYLRYRHRGVFGADYELQLDACRRHTAFYYHSLGEYLGHFAGRDAAYVSADAPASSADGGFAALKRVLGVADAAAGDAHHLFAGGDDGAAWSGWLNEIFATKAVT